MYPNSSVRFDTISGHNQKLMSNSQIELSVSARKLVNRDITSKSDPQCFAYIRHGLSDKYIEIGRTEMIKNNLNPDWVTKFALQFKFNESQQLKFEIWDVDPISGNEFLGQIIVELAAILAANGGTYTQKLTTGGRHARRFGGEFLVRAEELSSNKQIALMSFSASNLDKKDFLGKSDPYLVISKANTDGSFSVVHKTEVIKNNINPQWRAFNISLQQLCGGDYERSLKIDCFDWDEGTAHDIIGSFTTNYKRLSAGPSQQNIYECINNEKKTRKKGYKNSGIIKLNSISVSQEVSFVDYIRGGTQMHFAVSIDFTASNGDVRDQRSLHFIDYSGRPNSYEIALRSVGEIIKSYDTQGLFPSYGFGAKIPPHGQVSHHFPLNNNPSHPYCRGIEEIISFYKSSLSAVTLHGPTNFAPTIYNTSSIARGFQDGKHYFVLLIITDGVISDMNETLDAIVDASSLPMSIIIIGVGNADFSAMNFLDGDGNTIVSRGKRAVRDIVQFVPMNKYIGNWQQNQYELGRDVLAEIPTQFIKYMQSRGFKPSDPTSGSRAGIFPEPTGNEPTATPSMYPSAPVSQPPPASNPYPTGAPGYPPSGAPTAYPPSSGPTGYPPSGGPTGYPPSGGPTGYPPSGGPTGYPPSSGPTGYPPQTGPTGYPPPSAAYPPPGVGAYPPPSSGPGFNPSYPPTTASGQYPPQNPSYPPPTGSYPSVNPSYPAPNAYPSAPASAPNPYPPGGPPPGQYPNSNPRPAYPSPGYPAPNQSYPPYP